MRVAAQHLPISVASDEGDLFDRKTCFKETACAFMTQVVKMKVGDLQISALTPKSRAYRSAIVWKDSAPTIWEKAALLFDDRAGVIAADVREVGCAGCFRSCDAGPCGLL